MAGFRSTTKITIALLVVAVVLCVVSIQAAARFAIAPGPTRTLRAITTDVVDFTIFFFAMVALPLAFSAGWRSFQPLREERSLHRAPAPSLRC